LKVDKYKICIVNVMLYLNVKCKFISNTSKTLRVIDAKGMVLSISFATTNTIMPYFMPF